VSTLAQIRDKIASDLKRTNIPNDITTAINDAITEAAKNRFYFNEMHTSFVTVPGTEYYDDLGLVELDDAWYWQNGVILGQKMRLELLGQLDINDYRTGSPTGGVVDSIGRYGGQFRLFPVPATIVTIYVDGYGKLTPNPLVADGDTNAWLTEGELYIKALAKRNVLRDVVRDYGEAGVLDSIAEDYKAKLEEASTLKGSTGRIRATCW
jgi:hypothetical protein